MFFELSKFLNFFLISPIRWMFFLLIGFCLFKRRRRKKACLISCIALFLIFTNNLLVDYVKYLTVKEYSAMTISVGKQYKLAIVMGGFASMNRNTGQMQYELDRADRIWEAVRLWKKGVVERILITGDPTSIIQKDGTSTKELFLNYMEELGVPRSVFLLEQQARNTRENVIYVRSILETERITEEECVLITSVTHMKRSLKCFAKIGIHLDMYPVNTYIRPANINHRSFYPDWEAAMKWQELLNEQIGDIVYSFVGYI